MTSDFDEIKVLRISSVVTSSIGSRSSLSEEIHLLSWCSNLFSTCNPFQNATRCQHKCFSSKSSTSIQGTSHILLLQVIIMRNNAKCQVMQTLVCLQSKHNTSYTDLPVDNADWFSLLTDFTKRSRQRNFIRSETLRSLRTHKSEKTEEQEEVQTKHRQRFLSSISNNTSTCLPLRDRYPQNGIGWLWSNLPHGSLMALLIDIW